MYPQLTLLTSISFSFYGSRWHFVQLMMLLQMTCTQWRDQKCRQEAKNPKVKSLFPIFTTIDPKCESCDKTEQGTVLFPGGRWKTIAMPKQWDADQQMAAERPNNSPRGKNITRNAEDTGSWKVWNPALAVTPTKGAWRVWISINWKLFFSFLKQISKMAWNLFFKFVIQEKW